MVHEVDIVDQVNIGASEHQVSLMTKFQKLLEEEEVGGRQILQHIKFSQVAMDILAIIDSIVAFESTFNTGGCILDQFRNSLTPKLVESLICT
ncbi:hypothetical protein ACSBR1_040439 [Camellia fascicularis]